MIDNKKASLLCILGAAIFTMGTITRTDWPTGMKNAPILDPRAYGAICDGNTANATADTAGIQAAMDAVQYTSGASYTGHVAQVVQIPVGQCIINAVLVPHKPNIGIEGIGAPSQDSNMLAGSWLTAASTFDGPFFSADPANIFNYPSAGAGMNTPVIRGFGLKGIGFNAQVANTAGHFFSHWAVEVYSPSNLPIWKDLTVLNTGGCIKIAPSTSSSANNLMSNPELVTIENLVCFESLFGTSSVHANGVQIIGSNEIVLRGGNITAGQTQVTPAYSGTTDFTDFAAIEIISDDSGNDASGISLESIHLVNFAVHVRVRGADYDHYPFGQNGCATHPNCTMVSLGLSANRIHYGPSFVKSYDLWFEGFNKAIIVRDEGNPNGYATNNASLDLFFSRSNRLYFGYGTAPASAIVDFAKGGEISNGYRAGVSLSYPVKFGTNTDNITSFVNYFPSGPASITSTGNNNIILAVGRLAFSQLPTCFSSSCSPPSTDMPIGVPLFCVDCPETTPAGSAPTGGTGIGRAMVSNSGAWVGQ